MLSPTTLVAAVAAFSQLLTPVTAVDLIMYPFGNCQSPSVRCSNVPSRVCCHSYPNVFLSSQCIASQPGGIQQTIYEPTGSDGGCGRVSVRATCQGVCFQNRLTSGMRWERPGRRSVEASGDEVEDCVGTVEPDVLQFDGRAFSLNQTGMTQEQKDSLWALFDARLAAAEQDKSGEDVAPLAVPNEFDAFEVDVL
ncbi:hypothetical protein LIA77_01093 [Sarocladium implicatum]|nr:hypothetical protein LIA77_01093 [Sarocladium implicatum]